MSTMTCLGNPDQQTAAWINAHSAKLYVQDGLIAMWDGIENAGQGVHDSAATSWVDLIGGLGDIDLSIFSDSQKAWDADSLHAICVQYTRLLTAPNDWTLTSFTVEVVNRSTGIRRWCRYPWGNTFESWSTTEGRLERVGTTRIAARSGALSSITPLCNITTYDYATKTHKAYEYMNGVLASKSTVASAAYAYNGKVFFACLMNINHCVHAVRVYNRALTAEEIAHNYALDKLRFKL